MERARTAALALLVVVALGTIGGYVVLSQPCGPSLSGLPHDATVAVQPVTAVPDDAATLRFETLSTGEQDLLATAIDQGSVQVCLEREGPRTEAMWRLSERVSQDTHLVRGDTTYGLWLRLQDAIYVGTADPPA